MTDRKKLKSYDDEPVEYCLKCYSLKIRYEEAIDTDCCMDCGSTEIGVTDIDTWEHLYKNRYGHKFLQKSDDPRDSVYFRMSLAKLKTELYEDEHYYTFQRALYPHFPKGLSKSDSIILLFDKLGKDNRIDDLRYMLYDYYTGNRKNIK